MSEIYGIPESYCGYRQITSAFDLGRWWRDGEAVVDMVDYPESYFKKNTVYVNSEKLGLAPSRYVYMRGSRDAMRRKYGGEKQYVYPLHIHQRHLKKINKKLGKLISENAIPYYLGFSDEEKNYDRTEDIESYAANRVRKKYGMHDSSFRAMSGRRSKRIVSFFIEEDNADFSHIDSLAIAYLGGHVYLIDKKHYDTVNMLLNTLKH